MKTKFSISLILTLFIVLSCGFLGRTIEKLTEKTQQKVLKEFGVDNEKRERLMKTGKKSFGEIQKVEDTQITINNNPKVRLFVKVKPEDEKEFEAVIETIVSRVKIPRKGDKVIVYYDPNNKEDIIVD